MSDFFDALAPTVAEDCLLRLMRQSNQEDIDSIVAEKWGDWKKRRRRLPKIVTPFRKGKKSAWEAICG